MSDDDQVIESAELSELHRAVADVVLPERPPLESIIARGRGRRRNRQARAAGVAVAGLAAATVAVLGLTGAFAPATTPRKIKTAAFTLVSNVDGTATLTINPGELLDPAALQSDLAEYHVPAIVTAGKFCQSEPAPSGFSEVVRMQPSGGYTVAVGSGERPTITFDPSSLPAGTELSFGYFQLQDGQQQAMVALIDTSSYTCSTSVPSMSTSGGFGLLYGG